MGMADAGSSAGKTPSWGLVLVRIVVGWIVLKAGWGKVSGETGVSAELVTGTRDAIANAPGIVRWWGENVVLAHPMVFAYMIAWGELLGGFALFLGALTRPAGIALAFMFANFYFAGPESAQPLVLVLGVAALGCAISRAGRSMGADVFLDEKLPRWVTW
jgi:thiosulfate dehydrogenase [quinone] large subunit